MTVCARNYMKEKMLNNCVMYRKNLKVYISFVQVTNFVLAAKTCNNAQQALFLI